MPATKENLVRIIQDEYAEVPAFYPNSGADAPPMKVRPGSSGSRISINGIYEVEIDDVYLALSAAKKMNQ